MDGTPDDRTLYAIQMRSLWAVAEHLQTVHLAELEALAATHGDEADRALLAELRAVAPLLPEPGKRPRRRVTMEMLLTSIMGWAGELRDARFSSEPGRYLLHVESGMRQAVEMTRKHNGIGHENEPGRN